MTPGCPRERLFGNVVAIKVAGYDENSYFKWFPDVYNHLGEVQSLGQPGVGQDSGVSQELTFFAMLLKQKLLVMLKIVIGTCVWMSMTIWAKYRASDSQE